MKATEEKQPNEKQFFGRGWQKRVMAVVLAIVMLVTLVLSNAAMAKSRQNAEAAAQEEMVDVRNPTNEKVEEQLANMTPFSFCLHRSNDAITDGDYEKALTYAEKCLKLAGNDAQHIIAVAQKGNVLFYMGRYEEAEDYFMGIVRSSHQEVYTGCELSGMIARCQLLREDAVAADKTCTEGIDGAAKGENGLAELYVLRGITRMTLGQYQEAKRDFKRGLDLNYFDPDSVQEQIDQCDTLLKSLEDAKGQLSVQSPSKPGAKGTVGSKSGAASVGGANPGRAAQNQNVTGISAPGEAYSEEEVMAATYYFAGNYGKAAECYEALLGKGGLYTDSQLYANIAKCRYQQKQYGEAIENCTKALPGESGSAKGNLYTLRGSAYMAMGDSAKAAADFVSATENGCSDPDLNRLQATVCYYFANEFGKCVQTGRSLGEKSGDSEANLWVALAYYMEGDYPNAAQWLEKSLKLKQDYCRRDELCRLLARSQFMRNDYSGCIEAANRGVKESNSSGAPNKDIVSELYFLSGSASMSIGNYKDAVSAFQSALNAGYGKPADIYRQLTLCEFLVGQYSEAIRWGNQVIQSGGGTADIYYWVGLSYFSTGNYSSALSNLQKSEGMDANQENICFYIGVCYFSMGDYQQAMTWFTKSINKKEPAADRSLYNRALCKLQLENYEEGRKDLQQAASSGNASVAKDAQELLDGLSKILDGNKKRR